MMKMLLSTIGLTAMEGQPAHLVDGVPLLYSDLLRPGSCLGGHKFFKISDGIVLAAVAILLLARAQIRL